MLALAISAGLLSAVFAYTIGTGAQATGCTTCTLPPAASLPCSTCQAASPAPPITVPPQQWGHWGEWGPFGQCTVSCGNGLRARQRLCSNGCSTCQCIGSATEIQPCNTTPCPVGCSTCQNPQYPQYDPPTPVLPCTTCDKPVAPTPCPSCSYPNTPSPCLTCGVPSTNIQPAPSSCTTCGVNNRFYDPYLNAGRRKRSEYGQSDGSLLDRLVKG